MKERGDTYEVLLKLKVKYLLKNSSCHTCCVEYRTSLEKIWDLPGMKHLGQKGEKG